MGYAVEDKEIELLDVEGRRVSFDEMAKSSCAANIFRLVTCADLI